MNSTSEQEKIMQTLRYAEENALEAEKRHEYLATPEGKLADSLDTIQKMDKLRREAWIAWGVIGLIILLNAIYWSSR